MTGSDSEADDGEGPRDGAGEDLEDSDKAARGRDMGTVSSSTSSSVIAPCTCSSESDSPGRIKSSSVASL